MFAPHGNYKIESQEDVIIIDGEGPFNDHIVESCHRDVQVYLKDLPEFWSKLSVFRQNSLFTPDAEKLLIEISKQQKTQGLCAIAIVFIDVQAEFVLKDQISRVYQCAQIEHQFFVDNKTAQLWLKRQLLQQREVTEASAADNIPMAMILEQAI